MSNMDKMENLLSPAVECFKENDKFRIVSHYDADGISSASIILSACLRSGKEIHLSVVQQLKPDLVEELNKEDNENIIFTDLGSSHLSLINKIEAENIIILDHHEVTDSLEEGHHVNPHLIGLDEDNISGSGVTYLFAKLLSEENKDLASLAVIGAIGDIQEENWEMKGLNKEIVDQALESGLLSQEKGLRLFGRLSRPLYKALMYTTNPCIPGVSENESGAIQFLSEVDFDPKNEDGNWRKLNDLDEEEKKTLGSAIIQERINSDIENPEEIFGHVYDLENFEGKFSDARELSTALNACGRMSKPEVGVLACADDEEAMESMKGILNGYKRLLGRYINKVKDSKEEMVQEEDGFVLIDGIGQIHENFIGTVSSVLRSSIADGKPIMGLADSSEKELKISIRIPDEMNLDLSQILGEIGDELECETGGHEKAGGGYINEDQREKFIDLFKDKIHQKEAT